MKSLVIFYLSSFILIMCSITFVITVNRISIDIVYDLIKNVNSDKAMKFELCYNIVTILFALTTIVMDIGLVRYIIMIYRNR